MDGETFVARLEAETATQLERLGSERVPAALTDGTMEAERVLAAAAASEHAAAETFHAWAADEPDEGARAAFEDVAAQEDEHFERVRERLDAFDRPTAPGPMHAYLRGRSDTVERVATGLVARPLVSVRTHARIIDFFESAGDGSTADLFRDLEAETEAVAETGTDLLDARCSGDDWERASAAAAYLVQVAYDDYTDALSGVGEGPDAAD